MEHIHKHIMPDGSEHYHTHKSTKAVLNRLSKIIGHLESVKKMVENGKDCSDVLIQLSAVDSAVRSVSRVIIKDHLENCIVDAIKSGDTNALTELEEAIDKFLK